MFKRNILVGTIDNVKKLCAIAMNSEFDIDLVSGRYVIDAKSIMGIFSLDLSKQVEIHVHTDDEEAANIFFDLLGTMVK
jgi:phosphotransferase system HPr-like phosphotransfer protein